MAAPTARARRSRSRLPAALAVAVAVPLALAACASDTPASADPDPTSPGTTTDAPEEVAAWEPTQDINWVVPYSAGGGFDVYSRGLADVLTAEFLPDGINIIIRNTTPLAQGLSEMYDPEPNGYTIGILPMPAAVAMEIQQPEIARWETANYTVLGEIDENGYVIYVAADAPYETIEDLIAAQGLRSVSVDPGSSSGLAGRVAVTGLGLDAQTTYGMEGSAESVTALLRGDADFIVYGTSDLIGFVEAGEIRGLLFMGTEEQRPQGVEWLADVPSAEEAGFDELAGTVTELRIVVGPPQMPDDVRAYWEDIIDQALHSQAFADWSATAERQIVPRNAADAKAAVDAQIERMQVLVPQLAAVPS